ncbi:MAG: alpha/beta fold hydrolase [Caulobacteraceae bacterium]
MAQTPAGGRPIVAWAHPTSGIEPRCGTSLATFRFEQIMGLRDMIRRGYIVTATDYPGLGAGGPHPYLVGVSEGRAVLDSVRAAQNLTHEQGVDVALWGHSQGGQAVLYAGLLAASYAPELRLAGVAAAAPATELGPLMRDDESSPGGKDLLAMTLWSWSRVYGAPARQGGRSRGAARHRQARQPLPGISDRPSAEEESIGGARAALSQHDRSDVDRALALAPCRKHHRRAAAEPADLPGSGPTPTR